MLLWENKIWKVKFYSAGRVYIFIVAEEIMITILWWGVSLSSIISCMWQQQQQQQLACYCIDKQWTEVLKSFSYRFFTLLDV